MGRFDYSSSNKPSNKTSPTPSSSAATAKAAATASASSTALNHAAKFRCRPISIIPFSTSRSERRSAAAAAPPTQPQPTLSGTSSTRATPAAIPPPLRPHPRHHPTPPKTRPSASCTASPSQPSRPPLRNKDRNHQNAPLLTSTSRSTTASVAKMPVTDRPRQPQLSAAAARSVKSSPLTPKIASKGPALNTTPLAAARRPQPARNARDDVGSPLGTLLSSSHITPRSGNRQGRVDSASSTPTGTPGLADRVAYDGWDTASVRSGLTTPVLGTPVLGGPRLGVDASSEQQNDGTKFFYASDAKVNSRPQSVPPKPVPFFYANGVSAEAPRTTSPSITQTFTPVLAPTQEPVATKFFYANGAPDLVSARPPLTTASSHSVVQAGSRVSMARPGTSNPTIGLPAATGQRPVSPIKALSKQASPALPASPKLSPALVTSPALGPAESVQGRRKVSIDAAPKLIRPGHSRAGSSSTFDPSAPSRYAASPIASHQTSPPLSPGVPQAAMTMASLLQAAEDFGDYEAENDADTQSELASPSKSPADPVSELVANARRERKVQDLEITNASLEAINRTLERQLRKQTAELRRYRRLSRSGHIPLVSAASSREPSAALSDPPINLSTLTEEEASDEEREEHDSLDDSDLSSHDSELSDESLLSDDKLAVRRKRDERRLQLDLSKHQELLVDSQKMNQSIKRCLDWTEVLIKEGQKALAYRVRVSEVDFVGRVLAPLDEDEEDHHSEIASDVPGLEPPWTKRPQDRDSGIELPVDGG
ncbi:hypothetical protein HIM_04633 [Hirsutella minnesotensis 3608]|uniref:Uncharacterized protein n=1 Tax=Hirsutella minnesotensis 3608 TaxID=1043627 RepID=A0A0F8A1G3_9HYPO|nr:hypothetical protein HIM_04633 [Hirsutella minnesotensis 3608]